MVPSGDGIVRKSILMQIKQEHSSFTGHIQREKASSLYTNLFFAAFKKLAVSGKIRALTQQQ